MLYGSYTQTQAMSLAMAQAAPMAGVHARLIRQLERVSALNRELEQLPSDEALAARGPSAGVCQPRSWRR